MTAIAALPFLPAAVIFDMDGLMIDSERVSLACWSEAADAFGLGLDEAVFLRVLQHGDVAQTALVLLNKGDAARTFEVERYLQAGTWRDACDDLTPRGEPPTRYRTRTSKWPPIECWLAWSRTRS